MTTEGNLANTHRRIRARLVVGLAVSALVVGSVALAAVGAACALNATTARASTSPSITPAPTASALATATEAATPSPTPATQSATQSPTPTPLRAPSVHDHFVAVGTEPTVAADPSRPGVLAVASQNVFMSSPTVGCSVPTIRISLDGGATWGAAIYPWAHQCQDMHVVVAWGSNGRLWAGDAVGVGGGNVSMSVTHSDDMGMSWSRLFVQRFTQPWLGCFPTLTVDNWPGSPNFGTVYVAYNWLPNAYGPTVAVMATRDGTNWVHTEVPVEGLEGYQYSWRIGYRVAAVPDGTAFVAFYQSDLRHWSAGDIMNQGFGSNIGRMGFLIARVHFKGDVLTADRPSWATTVDHTQAQWQSGLAIDGSGEPWLAVESEGRVSLGRLDGRWLQFSIPGSYCIRPSLAISGQTIFVGWHAYDGQNQVSTYYTLSYDGGLTFLPPTLVSASRWNRSLETGPNGVGLRENADFRDGVVYYAYGDARSGNAVYVAQIQP